MNRTLPLLVAGPAAILLGACAASKPVMGEDHAAQAPASAEAVNKQDSTPLPRVALTDEVLYDILVGEIAEKRGQHDLAIASLMRAAVKTRDPRLAESATIAALRAKQYGDRKSTRLNSSHPSRSRMPSSA